MSRPTTIPSRDSRTSQDIIWDLTILSYIYLYIIIVITRNFKNILSSYSRNYLLELNLYLSQIEYACL